jgi:hypothetical protein
MFASVAFEAVCGKVVIDKLLRTPENCRTFLAIELMPIRGVVVKCSQATKDQLRVDLATLLQLYFFSQNQNDESRF